LRDQGVTEELYAHVGEHADHSEYSDAERVAIEYAERFALDHLSIDDAFFARLREQFSDPDVLDLTICIADFLGFGRLTQVLKLDVTCDLPIDVPVDGTTEIPTDAPTDGAPAA
jgi:alkylhydroperoxidase family enzyme